MCSTPACRKPSWNRSPGEYCSKACRDGSQQANDLMLKSITELNISQCPELTDRGVVKRENTRQTATSSTIVSQGDQRCREASCG